VAVSAAEKEVVETMVRLAEGSLTESDAGTVVDGARQIRTPRGRLTDLRSD